MTKKVNDFRLMMKGTGGKSPRCIALKGVIGIGVACTIYERRPSVCRAFEPSWQSANSNSRCDKARLAWGLEPLKPDSWFDPKDYTRAA
jgi:hypothetical protein